jgi:hypothetical protein
MDLPVCIQTSVSCVQVSAAVALMLLLWPILLLVRNLCRCGGSDVYETEGRFPWPELPFLGLLRLLRVDP